MYIGGRADGGRDRELVDKYVKCIRKTVKNTREREQEAELKPDRGNGRRLTGRRAGLKENDGDDDVEIV